MKFTQLNTVKTVPVIRLAKNQTIRDVVLGQNYHAILHGATCQLNPSISARIMNSQDINGVRQGAVQITKIADNEIHAKYLKGRFEIESETVLLADISSNDLNKKFSVTGKIETIKQTGGPTLFTLFDGSATLTIKGFAGAKKRAYPEIQEGYAVTAKIQVIEHEGILEGEIITIQKITGERQQQFETQLQKILFERTRPDPVDFLVSSSTLAQLKPEFEKAAVLIKTAIADNRPIILKHHNDTDGYTAAMALQRAVLPLVMQQHNEEKAMWLYYKRTPSKTPFYDYFDATRDVGFALSDQVKFNQKMPLIIIVDTGSGEEDALPIQKTKLFGCQVIVIDHHIVPQSNPVSQLADAHINPHLVGSAYDFSAGMLCTEIARLVNQNAENISYFPALSGLADRIQSNELKAYLAIAEKKGYSKEFLQKLASVIDFEAWNLRFDESRELVNILFGSNKQKQRELVDLLYPHIQQLMQRQLEISKAHLQKEEINNVLFVQLDIFQNANFNTYPPAGKNISALHDWVQTQYPNKPVLSIGYGNDFVTIRTTDNTPIAISKFIARVQQKFPNAGIEGGGHEHAGSIKATPAIIPQIIAEFKNVLIQQNQ